jgi:enoyl-CoA hydratase
MAAAEDIILVERRDGVALVTLNRPQALNALSTALVRRIGETFRELQKDAEVGAAILTGAGRAFSAGVDLKELAAAEPRSGDRGASDQMPAAIAAFDRPLIGAINGFAITGGFELALMCDLLIASPEAKFADTHARIGVVPGWGMSQRLARWIGVGRAKELSFTGNYLSAEQALAWGLVNRVVPAAELIPTCIALARDMLSCDARVVREVKRLIDTGYSTTLAEGLRSEDAASREHMKRMASGAIAARRSALQERGRNQSASGGG